MPELYDSIGGEYARRRRQDPRINAVIVDALEGSSEIVNVGAGAGSYEPPDRSVVAVEPSPVMIRQRAPDAAPVVRGSAGDLPFADGSFDASLAVLTVHHWPDVRRGLRELRRVSRARVVVLTCDPAVTGFWLLDYFPEIGEIDRSIMPSLSLIGSEIGPLDARVVPIPHDCSDGFLGAFWRRPEAYLDADVRAGISTFSKIRDVERGLSALRHDLASGTWRRRYGALLDRSTLDLGYRLIVA